MRKNPTDLDTPCAIGIGPCVFEPQAGPEQAQRLREHLRDFATRAGSGDLPVALAAPALDEVPRGSGHFHLAPELFLQVAGWTRFRLPQGELLLPAGQALVMPPRLLHAERVGASAAGDAFCNIVVHAEGATLSCHIAHEATPARPGILHLEASRHRQAGRIHDWLADAARLGPPDADASPWADAQSRALVAAALAGVLRALDDADPAAPAEPPLVARVRMLIQNQLGDPALSVRRLAEHSGCTPDYLSHLFGRCTGEHLAAYIVRQRMARAARLLADSAMAGKEIAWACGFTTQSYFSRSFRAHFGATPKAWRERRASRPDLPLA
jgi:AraC-like DNA-binding protein